ncbi:hypothetical protein AVEN_93683-1 [Araneus ventricosus]|uniref:Uncharacterized protein n=1 Tax=Araneus ventricosus TaxID=182803 RepID=A0A4Y2UZM6_ARAVE|nr:hypothetical protein AVEN_93683-1 [Araneus ventricosus]
MAHAALNDFVTMLERGIAVNVSRQYIRKHNLPQQFNIHLAPTRKTRDSQWTNRNCENEIPNGVIDSRWIVPYSPLLLKMFDAHIYR